MEFTVSTESDISAKGYDAVIVVTPTLDHIPKDDNLLDAIKEQNYIDDCLRSCVSVIRVPLPCKRLVLSPTGPLNRDYDDVRRYEDAAEAAIKRAISAGVKAPLLKIIPSEKFSYCELVGLLGAFKGLYVPLEIREDVPERARKITKLGYVGDQSTLDLALKLENGRIVARDIGGSDPERMAAPLVEEYVINKFKGTGLSVDVIKDDTILQKEYPLFSAVNRCAKGVERHKGRIIFITYKSSSPIKNTLILVGKGVTYDTGGADIKAGGVMAGMHRDKCGSAAVAGFMELVAKIKPKGVKVIGAMAMVRNSVGSECYVADEIITSRSGVRVRIGNTDAEGRMAMGDVLCQMKEKALDEVSPYIFTIATLTGHCVLAYGDNYTAVMENGPARIDGVARRLQTAGDLLADPFEISTIRREDYAFTKGKSEYEDILQSNNLPSSRTPRGHQSPGAFLICASGLDKHGLDSKQPLRYSHIDIAGSSGPFPGAPTGAPVLSLAKAFFPQEFDSAK